MSTTQPLRASGPKNTCSAKKTAKLSEVLTCALFALQILATIRLVRDGSLFPRSGKLMAPIEVPGCLCVMALASLRTFRIDVLQGVCEARSKGPCHECLCMRCSGNAEAIGFTLEFANAARAVHCTLMSPPSHFWTLLRHEAGPKFLGEARLGA